MANQNRKVLFKKPMAPKINKNNKEVYSYEVTPQYGYYGFKLYFINEEALDIQPLLNNIKVCESYLKRNKMIYPQKQVEQENVFSVDLKALLQDQDFLEKFSISSHETFKDYIISHTEIFLSCMGLAMHQMIVDDFRENDKDASEIQAIRARLINNEPVLQLKNLKVAAYGKLVTIRGTVIKAGNIKFISKCITFCCSFCGGTQVVKQPEGVFTEPLKCLSKGCRAHSHFVPLYSSPYTKTTRWQILKLQELIENDQYENGRVPRTIECELTDDLVNCCTPGDDMSITGIVKVRNDSNKNKQASVFLLYLDAVSIINEKNVSESQVAPSTRIKFDTKDLYAIKKIHDDAMVFRLLVQSLSPSIFGHEIVKAGLVLALFGGTQNDVGVRSDSHVLVVGDPGLGKSKMLQACTNVAPRGVYVCGNSSTSSGLTVTMTRESGRDYTLEAGALVLADQGCCCIDEFDKMQSQHACLLEAMEQQTISIAKAGVTCNLPTRVSILAAANPSGGHYNKAKTISENLKISSPMLSRFDLIFILLDQPDEQHDMLLSEHVIALRSRFNSTNLIMSQANNSNISTESKKICISLKNKLQVQPNELVEYLPHSLFRKYIAYAQKYVHPKLNEGAKHVLKTFYLDLRKQYHKSDSTPITTRQLESLVRLTQARAKLELREEATADDAIDVVEIMKHSLVDVFINEMGIIDFTRSQIGVGMSSQKMGNKFLNLLQQKAELQSKSFFCIKELKEIAEQLGIPSNKFYNMLESYNLQGFLLKKGQDNYQLATTQF